MGKHAHSLKTATKSFSAATAGEMATPASASVNAGPSCCRQGNASLHRHPFLQPFARIDFARVQIAARIELADMHPMEFAGLAAWPAVGADHGAIADADGFQNVVGTVDQHEIVLLLVERREVQTPGRARASGVAVKHVLTDESAVFA